MRLPTSLLILSAAAACVQRNEPPSAPDTAVPATKTSTTKETPANKKATPAKGTPAVKAPSSLPPGPHAKLVAALPRWYRRLFELGRGWAYRYRQRRYSAEQDTARPDEHRASGRVTCRVAAVERKGKLLASQVVCAPEGSKPPQGALWADKTVYIASDRGLWIAHGCTKAKPIECRADLPPRPDLLPRPRTAGRRVRSEQLDPDSEARFRLSWVRVKMWRDPRDRRRTRTYCLTLLTGAAKDALTTTRCFARDLGVVEVTLGRNNGLQPRWHDRASLELAPPAKRTR